MSTMKINDKDLQRIYQSYVEKHKMESGKDCPTSEIILDAFDSSSSRKIKDAVVDHVSRCAPCAREFQIVRDILNQERGLVNDPDVIGTGNDDARQFPSPAFFRYFRKFAPALVLAGAVIFGIIHFVPLSRFNEGRGRPVSLPNQIQPLGNVSLSTPLIFKWNGLSEQAFYVLEIYDEALELIWESPKLSSQKLTLPMDIQNILSPGKRYFWTVSAFAQSGKKGDSGFQSFIPID